MRQPVLTVMDADFGIPLNAAVGPVGSVVNVRADFTRDPPSGAVDFVWKAVPKKCVTWGEYRTVPDFKRSITLRSKGALYVTAYDEWGFALQSQTVKVDPATLTGET